MTDRVDPPATWISRRAGPGADGPFGSGRRMKLPSSDSAPLPAGETPISSSHDELHRFRSGMPTFRASRLHTTDSGASTRMDVRPAVKNLAPDAHESVALAVWMESLAPRAAPHRFPHCSTAPPAPPTTPALFHRGRRRQRAPALLWLDQLVADAADREHELGVLGVALDLLAQVEMWTSQARTSPRNSDCQSSSMISRRLKTWPGRSASRRRTWNSERVRLTGSPRTVTRWRARSIVTSPASMPFAVLVAAG